MQYIFVEKKNIIVIVLNNQKKMMMCIFEGKDYACSTFKTHYSIILFAKNKYIYSSILL